VNGKLPIRIGNLIHASVAGGPYLKKPPGWAGVKMAQEIQAYAEINVPVKDFGTPDPEAFKLALYRAYALLIGRTNLYVGCMGGIGRTGTFLAGMAKVMSEFRRISHRPGFDPVLYVREHYLSHAVETKAQEKFIRDLDVVDVARWLKATQTAMLGPAGFAVPKVEVTKEMLGIGVLPLVVPEPMVFAPPAPRKGWLSRLGLDKWLKFL
jgi:hypothetical protein